MNTILNVVIISSFITTSISPGLSGLKQSQVALLPNKYYYQCLEISSSNWERPIDQTKICRTCHLVDDPDL